MKLLLTISVNSKHQIRYSAFARYWKKTFECNGIAYQLFADFKEDYKSVGRGALYNVLFKSGISLVKIIKMC
jgi:hypothetical protein